MSGTNKFKRQMAAFAKSEGLVVEGIEHSKHLKMLVRAKDGRKTSIVFPVSGSDSFYGEKKTKADIRRFARGGQS